MRRFTFILILLNFNFNFVYAKDINIIGGVELYGKDLNETRNWVVKPRPYARNPQIGVYVYAADVIYKYVGYYTRGASIIFSEGEEIASILMGDSTGWKFERLGNRLALKPISARATTNMTLITNKRSYFFELSAKKPKKGSNVLYEIRFEYPQEIAQKLTDQLERGQTDDIPSVNDPDLNFNYTYKGSREIAPVKVFDNGRFTYIQFVKENTDIPAVFIVDSEGLEGLVNYRVRDEYLVVERVASLMTLRRGNDIICLFNENLPYKYNVLDQENPLDIPREDVNIREEY